MLTLSIIQYEHLILHEYRTYGSWALSYYQIEDYKLHIWTQNHLDIWIVFLDLEVSKDINNDFK
jgi:hypothetical protein